MATPYSELFFNEFVLRFQRVWRLNLDVELVSEDEEPEAQDRADEATAEMYRVLQRAAEIFMRPQTARPSHLVRLRDRLLNAGVPEDRTVEFCLKVEAVRVATGRSAIQPLLDPKPLDNPVLNAMRSAIAEETLPNPGLFRDIPNGDPADPFWRLQTSLAMGQPFDDNCVDQLIAGRKFTAAGALPMTQEQGARVAQLVFGHQSLDFDWN